MEFGTCMPPSVIVSARATPTWNTPPLTFPLCPSVCSIAAVSIPMSCGGGAGGLGAGVLVCPIASLMALASLTASPCPPMCMYITRGDSRSTWLCSAVTCSPAFSSDIITGSTSSSARTRSPITMESLPGLLKATHEPRASAGLTSTPATVTFISPRGSPNLWAPSGWSCPGRPMASSTAFHGFSFLDFCATANKHPSKMGHNASADDFSLIDINTPFLSDSLVKTFNHLHASAQKLFIRNSLRAPAFQNAVDAKRLVSSEMLVCQIGIMNSLRYQGDTPVADAKTLHQGFKSAIISLVPEATTLEHVEGNGIRVPGGILIEDEPRFGIDETLNEPC